MKVFILPSRTETNRSRLCLVLVLISISAKFTIAQDENNQGSTLDSSLTQPVVVAEGSDVLLTCVAKDLAEHSIIWKYGADKILTAGSTRITSDKRISVLHDEGGDVYVLSITNSTHTDTGLYICEVNTEPPARSFHKLTILSDKLVAPFDSSSITNTNENTENVNSSSSITLWGFSTPSPIDHDYSECCTNAGVSKECMGFCSIKNILEGTTGMHPANCDDQFTKIVHCMADGKNHVPCCQKAQVPDICQDMCVGEYTVQTDDVRSHISCSAFTAPTLACIAEGVNILPPRPSEVEAIKISDRSVTLKWSLPSGPHAQPDKFHIDVTRVRKFVPETEQGGALESSTSKLDNVTSTYTIGGNQRTYEMANLEPFTYYLIIMRSENKAGQSLPSYSLRILTLSSKEAETRKITGDENAKKKPARIPSLPDVKECCIEGKVSHQSCIDNFCDPLAAKKASVPDLMICAPWSQTMFGCLADGRDHTECCISRGVPDVCEPMCSGNATSLNFKHFRCMEYMHEITNCILRGYGVLPSEPTNFRFSNVGHNVGLLHWDPPVQHADTVTGYRVTYMRIVPNEDTSAERVADIKETTYILENLVPNSSYEVFVEALNAHGIGDESTRIVFRTAMQQKQEQKFTGFDQEFCCKTTGVKDECLPLCQYNVTMSTIQQLTTSCVDNFPAITKCAAGGRDHLPCCTRRGVSEECQTICQGLQMDTKSSIFTTCGSYIGNIMLCLEEGVQSIPPPVSNFHALFVGDNEVELAWEPITMPDKESEVDHYEIYFKELKNNSDSGSFFDHENNINTTKALFTVSGLKTNTRYRFFVIARNQFGTSLPSSVVTLNVSKDAWDGSKIEGKTSPPHAIEVSSTGADFLTLGWTAPTISHHQDSLQYKLYFGIASNSTKETMKEVTTTETHLELTNLTPNTPYVIYMTVVGSTGESEPSETIVTWTDPIVPAFAEAPAIHPRTGLIEGGTMTVLCIALGTPTPKITFYLGGHPIRTDTTRHLVTTVYNITKDMATVSCYADNGYGTPMETSRTVEIEHKPYVRGPIPTRIIRHVGQELSILCTVDALPTPSMAIGRIAGLISSGDQHIQISTQMPADNPENKYAVTMTIAELTMEDAGNYYCKGNNTHGEETQNFQIVVIDSTRKDETILSCCKEQNVTEACLPICAANQLDVDLLLYSPECIPQLDKLMVCGSDGSDHRHCCSQSGVPRSCLEWCRGQPVQETESCALAFAPQVAKCFHEGQYTLPGPPRNIKVTPTSGSTAVASWDPPSKNAEFVELYRILWRREGSRLARKMDTAEMSINLEGLIPGVPYELVVKAGNANGTSQLTPPLKFVAADKYIIETKVYSQTPSIVGALVAILLLIILVGAGVYIYRGRKSSLMALFNTSGSSGSGGDRSFTNPIFSQEVTMSNLQQNESIGVSPDVCPQQPQDHETGNGRSNVLSRFGLQSSGFGFQRFS